MLAPAAEVLKWLSPGVGRGRGLSSWGGAGIKQVAYGFGVRTRLSPAEAEERVRRALGRLEAGLGGG